MDQEKQNILQCLRAFINQRPGLQFCNYGDVSAYRSEMRSITKAKHHAETLLNAVAWRDSITAADIIAASKGAFSGRLTIERTEKGGFKIDYCTGQYFPTEYRNAVCAVFSAVLWDYCRANMPAPSHYVAESWARLGEPRERMPYRITRSLAEADRDSKGGNSWGVITELYPSGNPQRLLSAGDYLRKKASQEFGRSIAQVWFR